MELVNYQVEDRIAILTIQNPPVNALGTAVQEDLRGAAARAMHDCHVDAIIITGAGTTFVAGADIRELERMAYGEAVRSLLPQLPLEIEAAPKPVIAAIRGTRWAVASSLRWPRITESPKQRRGSDNQK